MLLVRAGRRAGGDALPEADEECPEGEGEPSRPLLRDGAAPVPPAGERGGEVRVLLPDGDGEPLPGGGVAQRHVEQGDPEDGDGPRLGGVPATAVVAGEGVHGAEEVGAVRRRPPELLVVRTEPVGDEGGHEAAPAAEQRGDGAGGQSGPLGALVQPGPVAVPGDELALLRRRPLRRHLPLVAAHDGGWALAAAAGALVARRGGGAGGEPWVGYQAVAPLAFAALLAAGPATAGVTAGSAAPSRPGGRS
ncbi:hypothetical protein GCM10010363_17600 [Streptomyces omiyaensis]|nr:hypothetical protein GCM10010363_17600 [Streptomyces omiyaensis]